MPESTDRTCFLFSENFNCAQAVFAAFAGKYGLDEKTALKIASAFGGGLRMGDVCGAVSGAAMVIGLKYGQTVGVDTTTKADCYSRTEEFIRLFRAANGSHICKEILGCDLGTPEGKASFNDRGMVKYICTKIVASAAEILESKGY